MNSFGVQIQINSPNNVFEGAGDGCEYEIGIVTAKFNEVITDYLLKGATSALNAMGQKNYKVYFVPGAFEIPITCARLLDSGSFHGLITLGAVIRGNTPHFDYVAGEAAKGVSKVALDYKKPVIFGVLTTNTVEQAQNRAGLKLGNKGAEAAHALVETLNLFNNANI